MKKVVLFLLTVLVMGISVHAEDIRPILEDFHYGDVLHAMIVDEEGGEVDQGTMWAIDVSDEGNCVKVSVYCDAGYSLYDEVLNNVTASALYDEESGDLLGFMVTDDAKEGLCILGFVLEDGLWNLILEE